MRNIVRISIFVLITGVLFLTGCTKESRKEGARTGSGVTKLPHYSLTDVTHYHYEQGLLRVKVVFEYGDFYSEVNELRVENCTFVYYDRNGRKLSSGSSKHAILYRNRSLLIAEDDVVVVSAVNGARLETEYLEWIGTKDRFSTDRFVKISRKNGDVLTGMGMDADIGLRFITIRKNVKGSIAPD